MSSFLRQLSPEQEQLLNTGHYFSKQVRSKNVLMRFSHLGRYQKALDITRQYSPSKILDYGCGDATYLILNLHSCKSIYGLDMDKKAVVANRQRLHKNPHCHFYYLNEIDQIKEKFDLITCMEVLEHCTEEATDEILSRLENLMNDEGRLVVSVPIETGPALLIKQLVRRALGLMKFGHYQYTEFYNWRNLFKMIFATKDTYVKRNYFDFDNNGERYVTCTHYAFNWMHLREKISKRLTIERTDFTPISFLGAGANSQAWFICRKKT